MNQPVSIRSNHRKQHTHLELHQNVRLLLVCGERYEKTTDNRLQVFIEPKDLMICCLQILTGCEAPARFQEGEDSVYIKVLSRHDVAESRILRMLHHDTKGLAITDPSEMIRQPAKDATRLHLSTVDFSMLRPTPALVTGTFLPYRMRTIQIPVNKVANAASSCTRSLRQVPSLRAFFREEK